MFEVVILKETTKLLQSEFDALLKYVTRTKQERIKKFHFKQDAYNCLLGDILARNEINRIIDTGIEQIEFAFNEYGKPFVVGNPGVQFNISHTGHYVACVVADKPAGIDIELIKPVNIKIAERFFTPDETTYIKDSEQERRFYEIWTKKESRIKWEGRGLYKPLTSFSVLDSQQTKPCYYKIVDEKDIIGHVCTDQKASPAIKILDVVTFLRNISLLD